MKKVGIVGGLGPESTVAYYQGIIDAFKPTFDLIGYPEIAIESVNLKAVMTHSEKFGWENIGALIAKKFESLRLGGADFGVIASNTPHIVFDSIQSQTFLPLQSIVDVTLNHATQQKYSKLCLLGTKTTMNAVFYQNMFEKENIELVVPNNEEKEYIHNKLFSEIEFGIVKEETKKNFLSIIERIEKEEKVEGVILGCTELPMVIEPGDIKIGYLDTTRIHIEAVVDICRRDE